ncbi:MFS transporter [Pseudoroseomonas rhizosphaerae]|uniref:MFS transporter n=1 Tax=Teichococcus rhizosphaerae TaxID=1335062 RepID=A0A2C7A6D3_9PROT|nr:organoarsenical effux MFS transporter ArsJ [Pseudoroseomonas rhizosphaerae]PHK92875.1 MFS transporter [Pseudoroseomonas rhizosphaerae]
MSAVRNYLIVTGAYWGFTLTDGALRMLVLLHFYQLGYTPLTLAFLFLLYEAAGIFANLGGGWLAARFGIPRMLAIGLTLQIGGLLMLSALDPAWGAAASVAWVVCAQGISGVAKDLTKTASKSAIKASSQQGAGQLFRWVAWFTGSKNAMKGFGFFLGGFLLQAVGFRPALWILVALLAVALVGVLLSLPRELGKAKSSKSFKKLFAKNRGVNLLAGARVFMFGSRDVWFVVGLPVFLYSQGWNYVGVSTFLAAWTIGYGAVQALAPQVVRRSPDGLSREVPEARLWGVALAAIPVLLCVALAMGTVGRPDLVVVAGLAVFGFAFAVNSSLHSYLILAYAGSEKAAEDVGFYYAANAAGRLGGILLSGVLTQYAGLEGCLWGSAAMLAAYALLTFLLPSHVSPRRVPI